MWHKELGFSQYPLDPRSNPNLIGVEKKEDELVQYILQGNMCLLCGFTGSGKTSMLERIQKNPKLRHCQFVFLSADGVDKQYQITDAIKNAQSLVDMLLFRKPKRIVVLLDESHLANRILTESIKSKWNFVYPDGEKMIQSVVVSQIEPQLGTNFSGSFIDRLGHRVVQMRRLRADELNQVLHQRLSTPKKKYIELFDSAGLDLLLKNADGSVRALLEYTDTIFRKLYEMETKPLKDPHFKITKEIVFNLLQDAGILIDDKSLKRQKGVFEKILENKRLKSAVEMFDQFGALSVVGLAEKMDITKKQSVRMVNNLITADALIESHKDDEYTYYVLTPRLKHELVRQ